ncbi:MAG: ABC transporter ATP-binding protein [Microthrixaceae bacterium]
MSMGPPPGSPLGGPAGAGLPFTGIPPELAERAQRILDREPPATPPPVAFSHRAEAGEPFTLRRFLWPSRGALLVALLLVAIETASLLAGPLLVQVGVDRGITAGDFRVVVIVSLAYLGVIVANVLLGWLRGSFTIHLGERLMERLRLRVFAHLERLSLDFHEREQAGVIMTRMTSDTENLSALFQEGLVQMAVQGLTVIVIAVLMLLLDVRMAAVILLGIVPALIATSLWYRKRSTVGYDRVRDRLSLVLADLQENLAGVRTVAAFDRGRRNASHHEGLAGDYLEANLVTARTGAIFGSIGELLGVLGQVLILAIGGMQVRSGDLSLGRLFSFLLFLGLLFAPVQQLVQLYTTYQQGRSSSRKLAELLAESPSVVEAPDAHPLPAIEGRLELRDVGFAYRSDASGGTGPQVLDHFDLVVEPGETLAIVGPTGAGKSTVAKLVARFYDPTSGAVLVDGVDLRAVTIASLRRQLGVVPQEPFLFQGTVRDNLIIGAPDASDAELDRACREVGVDELVARLADGYDTPVHERGVSLSAGERQLLGLARAFVARPRVLILDEATSNLDAQSERRVESALDTLLEGRTAIVVVHRLSTARRADRIAVVDRPDGGGAAQVLELGTHDELVAADGRYAAMWRRWESHLTDAERSAPAPSGPIAGEPTS